MPDREVGNGESALEMLPVCCLCNSAFKNGPWGMLAGSATLSVRHTHTNTHKDDDDYNDDDDDMRVYAAPKARSLSP